MFPFPENPMSQVERITAQQTLENSNIEELLKSHLPATISNDSHLKRPGYYAVIRIMGAPYSTTIQEVTSLLRGHVKLIKECPIHIMMDRSFGRTKDIFVECLDQLEAEYAVHMLNDVSVRQRQPRLGGCPINILMSNPQELMQAIFPNANGIEWPNGQPVQRGGSRFNGFLTQEELSLMENHAVTQRRVNFSFLSDQREHTEFQPSRIPQRVYENMITILWKFPWYRTDLYTVGQRNGIFQATRTMVQTAMEKIEKREVHLDMRTVNQLVGASLHCPGFNPRMKLSLVQLSKELGLLRHMPEEWLAYFPFDTLTWLKPYNQVALEFFAGLIARGGPPPDTESHGLLNLWRDDGHLARWGPVWFEWSVEGIDPTWKMIDCITYEKDLMQRLIEVGLNTELQ